MRQCAKFSVGEEALGWVGLGWVGVRQREGPRE